MAASFVPRVASRFSSLSASLLARVPKVNVVAAERHCGGLFQLQTTKINRPVLFSRYYGAQQVISLQELTDRTLNVVKLFDKVNPEQVSLEAHFLNDLGLDSLDSVEIVMAFEDEFGIEISDEEAEKIFTCNDAIELLKAKLW